MSDFLFNHQQNYKHLALLVWSWDNHLVYYIPYQTSEENQCYRIGNDREYCLDKNGTVFCHGISVGIGFFEKHW